MLWLPAKKLSSYSSVVSFSAITLHFSPLVQATPPRERHFPVHEISGQMRTLNSHTLLNGIGIPMGLLNFFAHRFAAIKCCIKRWHSLSHPALPFAAVSLPPKVIWLPSPLSAPAALSLSAVTPVLLTGSRVEEDGSGRRREESAAAVLDN